ncbi:hypothetical protein CPC735_034990 [Coccidioides posadasii C735 delta SOWgp]|uniref:Transcriptional regulatory protein RXT2 N-terminal domain-containing protein n=1 Tax=Coccidioides posadasii (strain C735) TaxID=222929 RepID=C5P623_COCP7|nr:hypothetical protein CPC735_034990 [Coccidioides posadasii C735 delta SOWgp]EER28163.1 hypothetical protein CPC735_034990 [Coccidioides posadasii C735 delta SOWgp]|eukprot:XP_003070308.1 hypothetical protein CPC735_034990 [Coccidioides posadasii C735 delta SOWgp]
MASQLAMIEETIVGLKRALARERLGQDAYDEPITQPTNRGNKTRLNSKYVHEGSLGIMNGQDYYRMKVDHAGYTRHILQYNPPRYDFEGDELDDDDSDATADAEAAEENPYSGIALETLLAPIRHPSELPDHPSMAEPYKKKAILHMVNLIDKRLRQERYALWQAKKVHRQLLGDAPWIPCGAVEKPQDRAVFEPAFLLPPDLQPLVTNVPEYTTSSIRRSSEARPTTLEQNPPEVVELNSRASVENVSAPNAPSGLDTEMVDAPVDEDKITDAQMEDVSLQTDNAGKNVAEQQKGSGPEHRESHAELMLEKQSNKDPDGAGFNSASEDNVKEKEESVQQDTSKTGMEADNELDGSAIDGDELPEPPRRMTTRAQANQLPQPSDASRATSPKSFGEATDATDVEDDDAVPHPLYEFPSIKIDRNCGLAPFEAEEARHLLWAYIQKQSETVRLFADILEMLRKAYRLKEDVFEWCKAEGHVGEMSDGEDWYDKEKWGLPEGEDLKKGADEEEAEVEEGRATGKRGRRRG